MTEVIEREGGKLNEEERFEQREGEKKEKFVYAIEVTVLLSLLVLWTAVDAGSPTDRVPC